MVFAMLGMFEATPGTGDYVLSAPMLPVAHIAVPAGADVTITAPGATSTALQYVSTVAVDGADTRGRSWISHADLLASRRIDVALTTNPTTTRFGVGPAQQPPALVDATR